VKRRYTKYTYLGYEINRSQSGLIIRRHDLFEGSLKRKRFIYPHTIGKREARSTSTSSVFEDDGNELRGERVEMVYGFKTEKVEKLLLCATFGASSNNAKNNLYREWRKHYVVLVGFFREEMFSHGYGNICLVGA
jgi:hypothetical protein